LTEALALSTLNRFSIFQKRIGIGEPVIRKITGSWLPIRLLQAFKRRLYKSPRPSLNNLDRKLQRYLNFRGGFFIEAGANDGYSQSNTYFLEKKLGWRGILIEGIPKLYEKCKKERTGSLVYNYALVSEDYPAPTVTMRFAGLMSVVSGALKTDEEKRHLDAGIDVQHLEGSYSIVVPARTLESILDEIPRLPEIDFFSSMGHTSLGILKRCKNTHITKPIVLSIQ